MDCPDCKRTIPTDAEFCCYCGKSLRICMPCQAFYTTGAGFCGKCGTKLIAAPLKNFEPPEALSPKVIGFLYDPLDPSIYFEITAGDTTVGAGGNNDIIIDRPAVSWNHAIVIGRDDKIMLQDSASTNGTFLNGTRIRIPRVLLHGDKVRFGSEEFHVWVRPSSRENADQRGRPR